MKIIYDSERDILQIILIQTTVEETAQISPGLVIDYDVDGNMIGLELSNASQMVESPHSICYILGEANMDKPRPKEGG